MDKEDIIRMAREAGFESNENNAYGNLSLEAFVCVDYEIERFAQLVAAAEREAIIAKLLEIGALEDGTFIEAIRARGQQ